MPSVAPVPTTWPPPVPVVLSNSKDEISAVKVTLTRLITLRGLAAFVQGSGVGAAGFQPGRFSVYSHNAGTDRPLSLLGETGTVLIGKDDPIRGIEPALFAAPLDLDPAIYWIALHLGPIVGQGKWNVRGLTTGGRSILQTPAPFAAGAPAVYPAGGTAGVQRLALGGVGSGRSLATGAIVGTFIVGDGTLVGQDPVSQVNDPVLILRGKAFVTALYNDFHQANVGKPTLTLKGKTVQVTGTANATVVPGKAKLLLNGKSVVGVAAIQVSVGKSSLVLRGKAFALGTGSTVAVGKSSLILRGKRFTAAEVALLPTTPININLVPTTPQTFDLVPTVERLGAMAPTVIESR